MSNFPVSVYARRIRHAAELANAAGLDGLVFGTGAELAYLTGSWLSTHERLTALVIPAQGTPSFLLPAVDRGELARSALGELDVEIVGWEDGADPHALAIEALRLSETAPSERGARVGLGATLTADHIFPLQEILRAAGRETVLASSLLKELFMRKDEEEIDQLRAAGKAIDQVHAQVPNLLRAGITERAVAQQLEQLILDVGHTAVDFVIVGSGPNGANAHHDFSDRQLTDGDVVVVDIGGTWGAGYHSDCTRTYVVGGPGAAVDPEYARLYQVLYQAQRAAVAAVRPGVTAASIDDVARDVISKAGYGAEFIHRTRHGIGLSTHEEPFIMAGNDLVLEPGMAFSIEPGIYVPGKFGARIEDIVVVTETGCESLNNNTHQLA
ncbi:M24 family metallopeptidase [Corynebacterium epidermidicanis]|uniref:Xaa-Pro aminopeptidase n=1 Tax=Corynebacterium epidermidicanis TaxID=1050174 RepID=A0A0G3GRE7_9CORY|nr:Xaa-Pro peptidase family protein [Corynebacterium epidermidicanis]AKK03130.1 Xaa-Pro aminopeptidase [Corynebacterium epidermidicanis]